MTMTRRDYVAMADAFCVARNWVCERYSGALLGAAMQGIDVAVQETADVLAADNPRFDRERFLLAAAFRSCTPKDK